jgi:hypothetical protein
MLGDKISHQFCLCYVCIAGLGVNDDENVFIYIGAWKVRKVSPYRVGKYNSDVLPARGERR